MKRSAQVIFTVLALVLLWGTLLTSTLGEREEVSFYEQRSLAVFPTPSWSTLWDGSFFTDVETWLTDHVSYREDVMKGDTQLSLALGRPVVNDLLVSQDLLLDYYGFLTWDLGYLDELAANQAKAYAQVQETVESYGGYFCFVGLPQQTTYFADRYPDYQDSRAWHTQGIRTAFSQAMEEAGVPFLSLYEIYEDLGFPEEYYAKSDHHFTYEGAFAACAAIVDRIAADTGLPIPPLQQEDFTWHTLDLPFLGSSNRKLYHLWKGEERLDYATPKEEIPFTRADNGQTVPAQVFSLPQEGADYVDYSLYMGGDVGETVIFTNRPELPNALIWGDSFTNPLETLLWTKFDETRSLDYRYYGEMGILQYLQTYQPDVVLLVRDESTYFLTDGNGAVQE